MKSSFGKISTQAKNVVKAKKQTRGQVARKKLGLKGTVVNSGKKGGGEVVGEKNQHNSEELGQQEQNTRPWWDNVGTQDQWSKTGLGRVDGQKQMEFLQ